MAPLTENRKRLARRMKPNSIAVFNSNDIMPTSADGTHTFVQNTDLFYLCGIDQPETVLVLCPDAVEEKHREVLFVRETSREIRLWEGPGYTKEEASRLSGVPVVAAKACAYVASGIFAAVAGLCQAAQEQQGDPEAGIGYELIAIAMVVIGGTSLMGGRGGIGLTLLGVLTIGYLDKILSINAVPEAGRLMLTGIIIIVAVLTQRRRRT